MSESTITASPSEGATQVSKVSEVVIRLAGNSQDGIQAIGGFLARLAGRSEQEVMTFMTIPSTISGGPSLFQVRIGTGEVLSAGDEADLLVAFYQHSYNDHITSIKKGGIVLYDADHVEPNPEMEKTYRHVRVPISSLTVEAIGGAGREKGKNIFVLGLLATMFDLNDSKLVALVSCRFKGKDPSVLQNALSAYNAGRAYSLKGLIETFQFVDSVKEGRAQVVMTGNEAIAYAAVAAGIRFGAAYPITPSSEIMEILRHELPKYGGTFVQCEDEIASISMALGASYAGKLAITSSSGPGISLKMEALGWGVMSEMPLIVVDVQRGGPSTGLPTMVEQSDLNIAVYGSHGDAPRVVLAPCNVEDAFYTTIEAVNIARKYSVPVFILSDQAIGTRIEAFPEPDYEKICQDISADLTPVQSHKPFNLSAEDGITQHKAPGTLILDGKYPVVTGLEHDEYGHPASSSALHRNMTAKRRNKLKALAATLPSPKVYGPETGNVLLIGWGSSRGPIQEAVDMARAGGESVSAVHIRYIHPVANGLDDILARFSRIFVVELNDEGLYGYGQLAALLRSRYCDDRIQGINKTEGLTFKVREILDKMRSKLAALNQKQS
jgi:2-oxoglutarate ferredoxin oxidoreductase subunit alpha